MKSCLAVVVLAITLVALVVAGFTVPQRTITNGVEKFRGEGKARAQAALETARLYEDETVDELFVTASRVERVEEYSGPPPSDPPDECLEGCVDPGSKSPGVGYFSMEVTRFTIFGLPYRKFSLNCDDPR